MKMSIKMKKRFLWGIIVVSVILMASGCAGDTPAAPTLPFPSETPVPSVTLEPTDLPFPPAATPYPAGDTWDLSEEKPLEDWQIEVVMADLEQFWGVWQRFDSGLDCDIATNVVLSLPITQEAFSDRCDEILESGSYILGPDFDWLEITDSTIWPSSKAETWPGGIALELDTILDWETWEINPRDGSKIQTLYDKRTLYFAFLVYEEGMWRIYSLNSQIVGEDN